MYSVGRSRCVERAFGRLVGVVTLMGLALSVVATAQIRDIERGGGLDRPFVRARTRIVAKPKPVRPVKPKANGSKPVPVVDDDPESISISPEATKRYEAGRRAYEKGNFETAVTEFEAAIRLESRYVDALIDLGDAYFDMSDVENAADSYKRALVIDKKNIDARNRVGRASFARRDYDEALRQYTEVLKISPDDPEAIYNIALTYKALKRYSDAIPYFEKAIAARQGPFPQARVNLSRSYFESGKRDEAEAAARQAISEIGAESQASATAWYALATALNGKPDLPGATEALQKAISVCKECPNDEQSRYFLSLAQILESRGLRTQAADAYERFVLLAPFMPEHQIQEFRAKIAKLRAEPS